MPTGRDLVALLLTQDGDRYIFGHEVSASDTNPAAFDCSELIEWGCARLGVSPKVPDGSWFQARHTIRTTVANAIGTPGALLFRFSSSPFTGGRPASAHVAVSQGNGKTIEARSTRHGTGQFSASGRGWTHAGLIPGLDYTTLDPGDDMDLLIKVYKGQTTAFYRDMQAKANVPARPGDPAYWGSDGTGPKATDQEWRDNIDKFVGATIQLALWPKGGSTVDSTARSIASSAKAAIDNLRAHLRRS